MWPGFLWKMATIDITTLFTVKLVDGIAPPWHAHSYHRLLIICSWWV